MASERHLSQRANTFQMGDLSHHQQHAMRNGMSMERKMDAPVGIAQGDNLFLYNTWISRFSVRQHAQGIAGSLWRGAGSLRGGADPPSGAGAHRTIPGQVLGALGCLLTCPLPILVSVLCAHCLTPSAHGSALPPTPNPPLIPFPSSDVLLSVIRSKCNLGRSVQYMLYNLLLIK